MNVSGVCLSFIIIIIIATTTTNQGDKMEAATRTIIFSLSLSFFYLHSALANVMMNNFNKRAATTVQIGHNFNSLKCSIENFFFFFGLRFSVKEFCDKHKNTGRCYM